MSTAGGPSPKAMIVAEWVSKAEGDLDVAQREFAYSGRRNLDAVGFHLQQAIEKLMKAVLIDRGFTVPKIHELETLDQLLTAVAAIGPTAPKADLALLTRAAVTFRYPGATVSAQDAADMVRITQSVWAQLRPLV